MGLILINVNYSNLVYTCNSNESLQSCEIVNKSYSVSVEIISDAHEYNESKTGVNSETIKSLYPSYTFDENIDKERNQNENEEEFRARAKQTAVKFKELATKEDDNYTVLFISSEVFLSSVMSVLINTEYLINSNIMIN